MLWLYRLLYPFALLVGAPFYLRRMWRRGGYRENFVQRFGALPALPAKRGKRIWLQAVSVGELLAVAPLLEAWARAGCEVYLTTTTSTGYQLARERYATLTIGIGYFPLDWWPLSARAWRTVQPDLALLMEGERWPEHIAQAAARGVPILCLNARLSDRSFRRMQRVKWALRPLRKITRLLAASAEDAQRFRALGFSAEQTHITGNIKLDVAPPQLDRAAQAALRRELGLPEAGSVLMGASTWPGEEVALLDALRHVRSAGLACSLLLVPRHAERRREVEALLRERGLRYRLRSEWLCRAGKQAAVDPVDVALVDTTGELAQLLQVADLVFVGKSLPPHTQGQTPVESAILGKPILFGPGMDNFRAIARELLSCGAARQLPDSQVLAVQACELLNAEPGRAMRAAMGQAAQAWHAQNAGALARTLHAIDSHLY